MGVDQIISPALLNIAYMFLTDRNSLHQWAIRNILIENTEIDCVVELVNFAWSYYKPAKVGN